MQNIENLLENNENIVWRGKPQFKPFIASSLPVVMFGLIFAAFGIFPIIEALKTGEYWLILFPHFWVGIGLSFGTILYAVLVHKYIDYAITNKRVILKKGLIGRDYLFVDFDQITNIDVNVGILDKIFGENSGRINIFSAGNFTTTKSGTASTPYTLLSVTDPYNVIKLLKKVSFDIKTDINYPNDLRPKTNPGYETSYNA